MQTTTFRTATVADIDALVLLVTSAYRGDSSRVGWTTEADILEGARIDPAVLRDDILRERSLVLVVEQDGRPVACAHIADDHGAGTSGCLRWILRCRAAGSARRCWPKPSALHIANGRCR